MKKPGKFPRGVINPSSLSSSIDPERSEKVIISVLKSYLAQFGSCKPHILYFHGSFVEKFEVIEDKCTISHIRCCQCFTTDVALNVVIWLSFLSIKFFQSTILLLPDNF